jgi:hypothetical protein
MYTHKTTMMCSSVTGYMAEFWLVFSQVFWKHFRSSQTLVHPVGSLSYGRASSVEKEQRWCELLSSDTALFSHALLIGPHRKDVGYHQNADAPYKRHPDLLRRGLSRE